MNHNERVARLLDQISHGRLNRRQVFKRAAALGLSASAISGLAGGGAGFRSVLAQDDPGTGVQGGILRVATIGEPPTLDEHQTTASIVAEITYNMYETLFTYDTEYQPVPMLAESHEISEDELTHTIRLRQGVPFHNGEIMDADDVIASIERWGSISGVGERLLAATNELARVDDHTIEFQLSQPYGTILVALAHNTQACVIYPQSVIETSGEDSLSDFIGTGPYRFVEQQADRFIRFERFDDYASWPGEPDGYGGHKYAYVDQIEFIPVPDEAARVAGLQAGDYHLGLDIGNDQYDVLADAPGVIAEILPPSFWDVFFLNWESPMMSNHTIRQAFQAALDMEPMMLSGRGDPQFFRLDPGLMLQETAWHSTAGEELYNMNDPELARSLLEEAGYDGTPLRFLTTQEYSSMFNQAAVAEQQLEAAGFTVDLQVIDWATLIERRGDQDEWDAFTTWHGSVPDPSQITYVGQMNQYPGWWSSEESLDLAADLLSEADFEARFEIWEQIQANAYTEVPAIKLGDASVASYRSETIGGWTNQVERGVPFWNLWLNE